MDPISIFAPNELMIKARSLSFGRASGSVVLINDFLSPLGDLDPDQGTIRKPGYRGIQIKDRILVFKGASGSSVGCYILYRMSKLGNAPRGIICIHPDPILITGAIISGIPAVKISEQDLAKIKDGDLVEIDADSGWIKILQRNFSSPQ